MGVFVAADEARDFNHDPSRAQSTGAEGNVASIWAGWRATLGADQIPGGPPQNPEADSYFKFNWSVDEWTRGDFAGCMGPGVWTVRDLARRCVNRCGAIRRAGSARRFSLRCG